MVKNTDLFLVGVFAWLSPKPNTLGFEPETLCWKEPQRDKRAAVAAASAAAATAADAAVAMIMTLPVMVMMTNTKSSERHTSQGTRMKVTCYSIGASRDDACNTVITTMHVVWPREHEQITLMLVSILLEAMTAATAILATAVTSASKCGSSRVTVTVIITATTAGGTIVVASLQQKL